MNLDTTYLGLRLRNPLIIGASPFCDSVDAARRLEDAGAAALVMHSLFEEQVDLEQRAMVHHTEIAAESTPEAPSFFPDYEDYQLTPDSYVRKLGRLKQSLTIPVIASLNGRNLGGWIDYARQLESAGADAIELNTYQLATDPAVSGDDIEADTLEVVRAVAASVKIPVAVKLSPYYTSLAQFATTLDRSGAAGLVLFNRFYQPDFDLDALEVVPRLSLSHSHEILLRLRWLSILSPLLKGSLACSGGVHTAQDLIKALVAGAHAVQVVSLPLEHGPKALGPLLAGLIEWMTEHDYNNIEELRGALNLRHCPDPAAHERANYIKILQSWKV
jgi:dihydroorotate dehydrogenase (fumarate)